MLFILQLLFLSSYPLLNFMCTNFLNNFAKRFVIFLISISWDGCQKAQPPTFGQQILLQTSMNWKCRTNEEMFLTGFPGSVGGYSASLNIPSAVFIDNLKYLPHYRRWSQSPHDRSDRWLIRIFSCTWVAEKEKNNNN